jgi:hypothetical protein
MRSLLLMTLIGSMLATGTCVRAGAEDSKAVDPKATDPKATDPRAIVQKAIDAMGGEQKLAAYKTTVSKGTCTFYGNGRGINCTGEWSEQLPEKLKASYVMDIGGRKMTRVEIITKDAGWTVMGGRTRAASAEHVAEVHEGLEALYASTLLFPLKEPIYQLSYTGESTIEGRPAVGIKVSRKVAEKEHREFTLYFDKEQGYLVDLQIRTKGMEGREVSQDTIYSGYRDFDGVRSHSKSVTKRDGKIFLETEITDFKTPDQLPPHTFDKPETPARKQPASTAK